MERGQPTKYPGITQLTNGTFYVRVRVKDEKTGKKSDRAITVEGTIDDAQAEAVKLRAEVRSGPQETTTIPTLRAYAESLLARKIATNEIRSQATRRKWFFTLKNHLCPRFGNWLVDRFKKADIDAWILSMVEDGLAPRSINGHFKILRVILRAAFADFELQSDPTAHVKLVDESATRTYTHENPNALTIGELAQFLEYARQREPAWYALFTLGLATGRRPSELFPLRYRGPSPDLVIAPDGDGVLYVRRSRTYGAPMDRTKTGKDLAIPLPPSLVAILRDHMATLDPEGDDLLFPSRNAEFRTSEGTSTAIRRVRDGLKLGKRLSSRMMRRTYYTLCEAAKVEGVVAKSMSGHATDAMVALYTHLPHDRVRPQLGRIVDLLLAAPAVEKGA